MSGWFAAHLPVLPVLLPAFTAMLLLVLGDDGSDTHGGHGLRRLKLARPIALGSTALGLIIAGLLAVEADVGLLQVYRVGGWPAPFGIVLVIDRLSASMLLLCSVIALPVLVYACGGWDSHGRHFHPMFQFQLMGLNGAFVTGDLFNLFVFFEVLLVASYVLMLHGQGRDRYALGVHYVTLNLAASALFLIGVALIYAQTGTLNLAELALRVPQVHGTEAALLQVGGLLLLVVFGFKAALVPLSMWLPQTYAAAAAPVAALFAIMTKVGVYAIWRVHGVVFGDGGGDSALVVQPLLLPLALATSVLGVLGALAARTLPRLIAWLTVVSVGTVASGLGLFSVAAWSAALFYMVNSTLVLAGLFLLAELVAAQRGVAGGDLRPASQVAQPQLLGLMLLLAAASVAGLPPLPGFIGKLMILEAALGSTAVVAVWVVVLGVGLLTLIGLARAGSIVFWSARDDVVAGTQSGASPRLITATLLLLSGSVLMSIFAGPLQRYSTAAAEQLGDRAGYARAVLGEGGMEGTTRLYRGVPPAGNAAATGGHR